jgi:hypothetical protein
MKIYHEWSEKDDIKALYIYLYGNEHLPYSYAQIAEEIRVYPFNLNLRVLSLEESDHCYSFLVSDQSNRIFELYSDLTQPELLLSSFGL